MVRKIARPGDKAFKLEDYPLYNLNRTSATYIEEMSQVMKTIGVDQTIWRILMLLDDQNPSSVGELSRKSVTKMSTVTRILTRMESEGLVRREAQNGDRRVVLVHMSKKGQKALERMKSLGASVFDRAFEGMDADEIRQFTESLKKVRQNLVRSPYDLKIRAQ